MSSRTYSQVMSMVSKRRQDGVGGDKATVKGNVGSETSDVVSFRDSGTEQKTIDRSRVKKDIEILFGSDADRQN